MVIAKTKPTWNYYHIRVEPPERFETNTFRTQDVGRVGHAMRVAAVRKTTGRWATQAWRIAKSDVRVVKRGKRKTLHATNTTTQRILNSIRANYGQITVK